jgi:hypothetical protein
MDIALTGDIVKGIYLLILIIIAGDTASTFSRQGHKFLQNNYIAKHVIIICIIYFTIDYSGTKINHPLQTLLVTGLIWLFYILISKQNLTFTIIIFGLITLIYLLYDFMNYYKDQFKQTKEKEKELQSKIDTLDKIITYTTYIIIGISVIGFLKYYSFQKGIRKNKFQNAKFIFGSNV